MTAPLVRCDRVSRQYGAGHAAVTALRDASCEICHADEIAIVGPSGSGKSTLLHIMAGIDAPTSGAITWPALGDRDTLRPGLVAVVLQGPSLLPPLDVIENVALPLVLDGLDRRQARERAREALDRLGLVELGAKLPDEISGGQAQRVAVARAVAQRPRLLLADEPTGQLDRHTGEAVIELLVEAVRAVGAALVVSTHDRMVATHVAMRWRVEDGRLFSPRPNAERSVGASCSR